MGLFAGELHIDSAVYRARIGAGRQIFIPLAPQISENG
jgi:hypothetical protein